MISLKVNFYETCNFVLAIIKSIKITILELKKNCVVKLQISNIKIF